MLESEAIENLKRIKEKEQTEGVGYDEYDAHIDADYVLCQFLKSLGYKEIVDLFLEIPKVYS